MKKEVFEHDYNVNLDKVKFTLSENGLYEYSPETFRRYYIIKQNDGYECADADTNTISPWLHDLSELEEG